MASVDKEIETLISTLNLHSHPAGGHFIETFKSTRRVQPIVKEDEPSSLTHSGSRSAGTSVYYLLPKDKHVTWHMHKSDEVFIFLRGYPASIYLISQGGELSSHVLGDPLETPGAQYHVVVPHGTWYAAEMIDPSKFVLYTAVVTPGFEFEDWIEGKREELLKKFPQHQDIIQKLT